MKTFLLAVTTLFVTSLHAQKANPASKELIKQLFAVMHQDSLISKTMDAMYSGMLSQTKASMMAIDSSYGSKMDEIMIRASARSKAMAFRLINEDMVDIYSNYFTTEDVQQYITFYKSAAGQKMLNQLPNITKDMMAVMTAKYTPAMQAEMMKDMEQLVPMPKQQ